MISASSLARVIACPASAVLPAVVTVGDAAERGTDIHAFMRRVLGGVPRSTALEHVSPENRVTCEGIDFAKVVEGLSEVRSEVSYALHAESLEVREIGRNIGRNYPSEYVGLDRLPWLPGTLDMEGFRADGVPVVEDFKTGQPVDAAAENPQLFFFALVRRALTGANEVEIRIRYVREDGRTYVDRHVADVFELDSFAADLERTASHVCRLHTGVEKQDVTVRPGSQCRYCPAITSCPAHVALARAMSDEITAIDARIREMTPAERGNAWIKAKMIEGLLEHVITGLRECAIAEPTPLPDGKVLRLIESQRRSFVQADAIALLRRLGATQEQIDECYRATTIEQVRATNPEKKKGRKAA